MLAAVVYPNSKLAHAVHEKAIKSVKTSEKKLRRMARRAGWDHCPRASHLLSRDQVGGRLTKVAEEIRDLA
jgi:hypothetical protein